jgi:hypothetical protein
MALLETLPEGCAETVMLTAEGFVAEATTDNLFMVLREAGWESNAERVTLFTPSSDYCLKGITRGLVLAQAKKLGFKVIESAQLLPQDLIGPQREVFLTGTAAGLVPVITMDGQMVGDGIPGPVTATFRDLLAADMNDPAMALSVEAGAEQINVYLKGNRSHFDASRSDDTRVVANLITRLFERVDSRNWEALREVFTGDIIYERPGYEPLVGIERVIKFYRAERVIVSGRHYLENMVLNEHAGACWGRFIGMHKNNSAIDERFADVYRFKNGMICNRQSYFFRPAV